MTKTVKGTESREKKAKASPSPSPKTKTKLEGKKEVNTNKNSVENNNNLKKYFTKTTITYFILLLLDVILVIYSARNNIVNYVRILDKEIFASKTSYLLLGRNYINVFIIAFFYIYTCVVNKFFLKRKNTKKFLGILFIILVTLNLLLFMLFTKKVY